MKTSRFWRDLAERVAATFVGGFLSGLALPHLIDAPLSTVEAAAYAGVAAVLAMVKGMVATSRGDKTSASLMRRP